MNFNSCELLAVCRTFIHRPFVLVIVLKDKKIDFLCESILTLPSVKSKSSCIVVSLYYGAKYICKILSDFKGTYLLYNAIICISCAIISMSMVILYIKLLYPIIPKFIRKILDQ